MDRSNRKTHRATLLFFAAWLAGASVLADEIGRVKKSSGSVNIERGGKPSAASVGATLQSSDWLVTGSDGSVGITLSDNSLLSAGPNSRLELSRYAFDSTTHQGRFDATLRQGTLSMVSGKLAKQSPDAVRVITPSAVLAVRGTEFFVKVDDEK